MLIYLDAMNVSGHSLQGERIMTLQIARINRRRSVIQRICTSVSSVKAIKCGLTMASSQNVKDARLLVHTQVTWSVLVGNTITFIPLKMRRNHKQRHLSHNVVSA